ncbi:hypothetical protein SKAU_G00419100 [Synaphobranchus kaupii]|uniref:Uncharacterized protein n=1 Tax=Synaphobranchus kaupii TaxID=118154 RepID=A0A9Q1IAZ4_SYNKA|nr:hypothetical protein SKAU_G00419100 [Synaphobranchus kaupii]
MPSFLPDENRDGTVAFRIPLAPREFIRQRADVIQPRPALMYGLKSGRKDQGNYGKSGSKGKEKRLGSESRDCTLILRPGPARPWGYLSPVFRNAPTVDHRSLGRKPLFRVPIFPAKVRSDYPGSAQLVRN